MIKAKHFWNYLCNDLNYRFFAGKPCVGFKQLYKNMNSKIMHYIPAANSDIAVGLVSGASLSGHKGAVLLDAYDFYDTLSIIDKFNIEYEIPFLLLIYNNGAKMKRILNLPTVNISKNYKKELLYIDSEITKKKLPGMVLFNNDII